ncbi:hypothetical protein L484_014154 [Morus notabilis]|uniref:Uncharacterized protein n=1 Tax=Morus notabilis TaxID=981085 RepID=W9RJU2_9ROSA|nr:hypothetical protein L484_014154 [Morus notabilis]
MVEIRWLNRLNWRRWWNFRRESVEEAEATGTQRYENETSVPISTMLDLGFGLGMKAHLILRGYSWATGPEDVIAATGPKDAPLASAWMFHAGRGMTDGRWGNFSILEVDSTWFNKEVLTWF